MISTIDKLTAERDALRAFAQDTLKEWPNSGPDEFDIQESAIKHGLLELKNPAPIESCGEGCECFSFGDAEKIWPNGVECYRRSELLTGKETP